VFAVVGLCHTAPEPFDVELLALVAACVCFHCSFGGEARMPKVVNTITTNISHKFCSMLFILAFWAAVTLVNSFNVIAAIGTPLQNLHPFNQAFYAICYILFYV